MCLRFSKYRWRRRAKPQALLVFWFIPPPVESSRWKDGKVREASKSKRSHRHRLVWRELKVEEDIQGHGGKLHRLDWSVDLSKGGRSLHEDLFQICVCVSRVSCNKLLTTATLCDLQLVCGSYPLTPYLIDSKSLSYAISASDAYGTGSWTQSHTHAPEQMPCTLMQARKLVNHLYTGRKSLFVVSANSLLPRIDRPRWFDDALRSPWTQTLNV